MAGILAALASGLPTVIGGLLGRKKAKAQGIDYMKLRRDAEAAGFNPLTALLAGGGAGYQREFNPALASGSFVSEALSRGLDTYFNTPDPSDAEAERLRDRFKVESLYEAQRDSMLPGNFGYALSTVEPFRETRTLHSSPLAAASTRPDDSQAQSDQGTAPPVVPLQAFGVEFKPSGRWSDGDGWETRYGDLGGSLVGGAALATDVAYNVNPRLVSTPRQMGDNSVIYHSPMGPVWLPASQAWQQERKDKGRRKPQFRVKVPSTFGFPMPDVQRQYRLPLLSGGNPYSAF